MHMHKFNHRDVGDVRASEHNWVVGEVSVDIAPSTHISPPTNTTHATAIMCMSIVITHHQFQCVTRTTPSINTKTTHRTPQHRRHAHTSDSSWPTCLFTLKPPNPFTARHHCFTHKRPRPRVRCCCCSQVKTDSKIGCKVLYIACPCNTQSNACKPHMPWP